MTNNFLSTKFLERRALDLIRNYKGEKRFNNTLKAKSKELFELKQALTDDFNGYKQKTERALKEEKFNRTFEILKGFIPVLDNLELGIGSIVDKGYAEGFNLVMGQFATILKNLNVTVINPLGKPFDPNLHEVISFDRGDSVSEGSVCKVLRKGFLLDKKLLRPASVVVIKN
jgi:molecular chaperone GrpE